MRKAWATSGDLDLHLDLGGPRVRAGLEAALRQAVRDGRLRPGTRMPSSRILAADLGVARNTVAEAYTQLVAEGWLVSRHGSGTWTAGDRLEPAASSGAPATAGPPVAGTGPVPLRWQPPAPAAPHDLRPGMPDLSSFPRAQWAAAVRRALTTAPRELLGYGDPRGLPALRQSLAGYLARTRGLSPDPDHVVVVAGFADGLDLLCQVLAGRGITTVAVEGHGHDQHRAIVTGRGLAVRDLPVDADGAIVGDLDADPALGAVLLTPAHQFPTGVVLSPTRRRQATEWAQRNGAVLIEDDYDGEFRYDRHPIAALASLTPAAVAYAGTASKSLAPGLRLGWLIPPAHLLADVVAARAAGGRLVPAADQLALADLLGSGDYDRHVRRNRLRYRRRRDALIAALARQVPAVRVTGIAAGLHALAQLPDGIDEQDVVAEAARRGLAIHGLRHYTPSPVLRARTAPALVVGYAAPPDHGYTAALARLTAALAATV